ncbi:hypothetical protein AB0J67_25270, partial [Catellatospora sp. NPDC049609]
MLGAATGRVAALPASESGAGPVVVDRARLSYLRTGATPPEEIVAAAEAGHPRAGHRRRRRPRR